MKKTIAYINMLIIFLLLIFSIIFFFQNNMEYSYTTLGLALVIMYSCFAGPYLLRKALEEKNVNDEIIDVSIYIFYLLIIVVDIMMLISIKQELIPEVYKYY